MPRLNPSQNQFLATLYDKIKSNSLKWTLRGTGSYQTDLGQFRIHVDGLDPDEEKRTIWIFKELELLDRISEEDAGDDFIDPPGMKGLDLVREIYSIVSQSVGDPLKDVVDALKHV